MRTFNLNLLVNRMKLAGPLALAASSALMAVSALAADRLGAPLTVQGFLEQVADRSPGVKGALQSASGAQMRAGEGSLLTTPFFFANGQWAADERPPQNPILSYSRVDAQAYSLGIQEQFAFGLQAKLSYNANQTSFKDYSPPPRAVDPTGFFQQASYFEVTPRIEVSMPFWGGGFGRGVRAQRDAVEASALSASHAARFQAGSALVQAEGAYWRLAFARNVVEVQREALERGRKIQEFVGRQARLSLADRSDALQSDANFELRKIDLQAALDEERAARLAFNVARGGDGSSDEVPERLESIDPDRVLSMPAPARGSEPRSDVQAAEQQSRAAIAQAESARERDLPTLDVYASYQLYGREESIRAGTTDAFSKAIDTRAIGVRFQVPIDVGAAFAAREGWAREKAGAELTYRQRQLDEMQSWDDLSKRLVEARARLGLLRTLERTQEAKLGREKERQRGGRSTTFQVLTFEQDFAQSQIARIRAEADVINSLTQMKIFTNAPMLSPSASSSLSPSASPSLSRTTASSQELK